MISVKDIFKNIDMNSFVILRYLEKESLLPSSGYAHVIYDYKNLTCDSVHSHPCYKLSKKENFTFDDTKVEDV